MKFKYIFLCFLFLANCTTKDKVDVIVYPDYCGGCVERNFQVMSLSETREEFNIYFDSTDRFILNQSKRYDLNFIHINNDDIAPKFGDYANLVVINLEGDTVELKTNETIEKGKHFKEIVL